MTSSNSLLKNEILETFRELQSPQHPTFFKEYLGALINAIPGHLEGIRVAIEKKDTKQLVQSAHAIRSSCANLHVIPIVDTLGKIEAMGEKGDLTGVEVLYTEAVRLCTQLKKNIQDLPEFK